MKFQQYEIFQNNIQKLINVDKCQMQPKKYISSQANDEKKSISSIMKKLQTEEFIDLDFPHRYQNIYSPSASIHKIQQVIWMPCQELHHKPFYSRGDFSLDQIVKMNLITQKINHTLILIKFFAPQIFAKLIKPRQLSFEFQNKVFKYLHYFDMFVNKSEHKVLIDSYIPVSEIRNKELFCENIKGCIFPCLVEKLLAKLSGGYQNINGMKLTDMIEIFTHYLTERVKMKDILGKLLEEKEQIAKVSQLVQQRLSKQKGLMLFRTRINSKLQSFGLKPNYCYFVVGLVDSSIETDEKLISFLELPENQSGSGSQLQWIGKFSKYRADNNIIQKSRVNLELRSYENFMSLRDLIKVTKEFVILHNTANYQTTSKQLPLINLKNLYHSYFPELYSSTNLLIQEKVNSQLGYIKQDSQKQIHRNLSLSSENKNISKVQSLQNNEINEQKAHEKSGTKNELSLIWECVQIAVYQNGQKDLNIRSQKIFLNFRVQWQNHQDESNKIQFLNVTLAVVEEKQNNLLKTQNSRLKSYRCGQISYFDIFIELTQRDLTQIQSSIKLILLIDMDRSLSEINRQSIRVKIASFSSLNQKNKPLEINSLCKRNNQTNQQKPIFSPLLSDLLKSMLLNSQHQSSSSDQPIEITCRQFIDQLNLGVIYIRINQQKTQNKKLSPTYTIQLEINAQIMLSNGIYLIQKVGKVKDYSFSSNKHLLTYRLNLVQIDNPEFILLFRINFCHQIYNQAFSEPKSFFQYPPLESIKISRIFEANI